jgi:hypothetical protein
MTRVVFAYPGGEMVLKEYRAKLPVQRMLAVAEDLACHYFGDRWSWEDDAEVPAISVPGSGIILITHRLPVEPCL